MSFTVSHVYLSLSETSEVYKSYICYEQNLTKLIIILVGFRENKICKIEGNYTEDNVLWLIL